MLRPLAAVVLILLGTGLTVWYCFVPEPPGVTRGNFDQTRPGMTIEEVRCLLGSPGEDADDVPPYPVFGKRLVVWSDLHAWVWIGFENDRVVSKFFNRNTL